MLGVILDSLCQRRPQLRYPKACEAPAEPAGRSYAAGYGPV